VLGALCCSLVVLVACATTGSGSGEPSSTATQSSASPPTPPPVVADAKPAPAPAAAPPPAAAAPPPEAAAPAAPAGAPPASGDAASKVAAYRADPAAIQRASQLFRAVCTGYCHSTQPTAERVAPNLFDCDWTHGGSEAEIFHTIAAGVPDTQMQGFGERLPEEDLWKIVAFLRQKSTCPG